jgi:uncharacterized membrane protein YbhN (UPF0104 family)
VPAVATRRRDRLTAALAVLACVAIIDTLSEGARFAVDANDRLGWLRLILGGLASLVCSVWVIHRYRAAARIRGVPAAGAPARDSSFPSGSLAIRWPVRAPAWLTRSWPWLRRLAGLAIVGLGATAVVEQWGTLSEAVNQFRHLNWRWLRWAIYAELASVVAYAWLWQALLRSRQRRLRFGSLISLTVAGNALMVTLPGGLAWSTAFSFNAFRRRGIDAPLTLKALVGGSVISILALVGMLLIGVDMAGSSGPLADFRLIITLVTALVALGGVWLIRRVRRSGTVWALTRDHLSALAAAFPRRSLASAVAAATSNWLLDCGCLVLSILAVAGHVPWQGVLVTYAVGQLAQQLPITPGGIGVVEGTLTLLLVAYGMHTSTALAAVLLYRIISFWTLVPAGWAVAAAVVWGHRRQDRAAARRPLSAVTAAGAPSA